MTRVVKDQGGHSQMFNDDFHTYMFDCFLLQEEPKRIEQDEQYARELHAELNKDIDWDEAIDHVKRKAKEDPIVQRYQVLKRKPQTEAQARKNMIMYLMNVAGFKMDYFKGMSYDDIRQIFEAKFNSNGMYYDDIRPIFEVKFNSNIEFLLKTKEQMEEKRAEHYKASMRL
nr:hypothetical protein [Tanacetum cinerariifolium]